MPELTLFHGDCLNIMKDLPDKSIDLFICDLPYGCLHPERKRDKTKWYDSAGQARGSCSWDVKIDLELFWTEVRRLRKSDDSPCIHFCTTRFGNELINSNPSEFRYDLVWDKQRGVSFLSANKMPMRSHEMIYVFSKAGAFYERVDISGRCAVSVIDVSNSAKKGNHPTEKPVDLYRWLIERYCPPGGTVLDPTFGSGNSVFTAFSMGRNGTGIEKDEKFYDKAAKRLEALP